MRRSLVRIAREGGLTGSENCTRSEVKGWKLCDPVDIGGKASPKPRAVRLRSATDARKFLARTINKFNRGEIDGAKAGRLTYMILAFVRTIEISEIEKRIADLEESR